MGRRPGVSPHRLVRLYPAAWRARYGDEFLALLEARPARGRDLVDIAASALDAHLFPQALEGRFPVLFRLTGLAALGAGVALLLGFLRPVVPGINEVAILIFNVLALVGLVGIHARQVAVRPALAWFGFALAGLGLAWGIGFVVLTRVGILPSDSVELGNLATVALFLGSAALGAVMLAIRSFPVIVGLAFAIGAPMAMVDLVGEGIILGLVAQLGIALYAFGWLGAGWSLVSAQPEEGVLGPANP
jgi:hypothetical protein